MRKQPVAILLWSNGPIDHELASGCVYFHEHAFNVGQHVAHNEMLDECVRRGYDWHARVDDDCWITTKTWLKRLLAVQEEIRSLRKSYAVLGMNVCGLNDPPAALQAYWLELGRREKIERVGILGGIFRMAPMSVMRYFRWDERQSMGHGDATQFARFCESAKIDMWRVATIRCEHGGSTNKQRDADTNWNYEHDMLQYMPLGL